MWPDYRWLRRYRPGVRRGWLGIDYALDHLPWPQVGAFRGGDRLALAFMIGPLGPDPVLLLEVSIPRPGSRRP